MKNMQKINRIILVVVIIGIAVFVSKKLISQKQRPKRLVHESSGAVVDVVTAQRTSLNLHVAGTGLVQPLQEVQISPQVAGMVVFTSPRLVESGFFKKNEVLFKLEDTDSILVLEQTKADLAKTELDYALIQGKADIALQEWKLLNEKDDEPDPLVVYKPQLASGKAMLASARARVKRAELDVQRTTIKAPFNCFVRSKDVEIGQYVKAGNVALNLVGTDQAEITVPLALADVAVLVASGKRGNETPGKRAESQASTVTVRLDIGGTIHIWQGYIDRFGGEVDAASRMRDAIVVVDDPYVLNKGTVHTMSLVMGSFVAVDLVGRQYDDVVQIPRMALRDDSTVWIAMPDSTLQVRNVTVLRKNQDNVIVDTGLIDGDRVILTPLRGASPGMKLRVLQHSSQQQSGHQGDKS